MSEVRRKVIGEALVVVEKVKKTYETKNKKTETIVRETYKATLLDCGHKIRNTDFLGKVPKMNTRCFECEYGDGDHYRF